MSARGKDNVWSIDNETDKARNGRTRKKKRERRVRKRSEKSGMVMVSGSVLMEVETVLQTQVCFCVSFCCVIACFYDCCLDACFIIYFVFFCLYARIGE